MIRRCEASDFESIWAIINDGAQAYKGIIPEDCCDDPYMSREKLRHEISEGVEFWGYQEGEALVGVMGIQQVYDATLIRHAYVRTGQQNSGIGTNLLAHLRRMAKGPILIGTWKAAVWAVRFYEKHGFRTVGSHEKDGLLRKYWTVPERQIETSAVLTDQAGTRNETRAQTEERLLTVISRSDCRFFEGAYAFEEFPLRQFQRRVREDALALVHDDEVWSQLIPCTAVGAKEFAVFRFQFPADLDNSGFVGWLASHLRLRFGTGVFVTCGQNSMRGGIFDYWGVPIELRDEVFAEVRLLQTRKPEPLAAGYDFHGKTFRVVRNTEGGEASAETVFQFGQRGDVVFADYSGGPILVGRLVGKLKEDSLEYDYVQVNAEGVLRHGSATDRIERTGFGKLRLHEHWTWHALTDGKQIDGTLVLEEA